MVNQVVDPNYKANTKNVRELIVPIVDTVKSCGRQNIPLPCHRGNAKITRARRSGLNNVGRFIKMLNFRIKGCNKVPDKHFRSFQQDLNHISLEIQNDLGLCCRI